MHYWFLWTGVRSFFGRCGGIRNGRRKYRSGKFTTSLAFPIILPIVSRCVTTWHTGSEFRCVCQNRVQTKLSTQTTPREEENDLDPRRSHLYLSYVRLMFHSLSVCETYFRQWPHSVPMVVGVMMVVVVVTLRSNIVMVVGTWRWSVVVHGWCWWWY